jgi:hypothetical protein
LTNAVHYAPVVADARPAFVGPGTAFVTTDVVRPVVARYRDPVHLWQCALWGLLGGAVVEGLEWAAIMRNGRWPWNKRRKAGPLVASILIRLGAGSGLAAAVGASGPVGVLGTFSVGVGAPLIIEKIAQQIPASYPAPYEGQNRQEAVTNAGAADAT